MMISVFAMHDLALQDFDSKFEGKTWAMYSYPQVKMSYTPSTEDASTVRWAMWSISAASRDMIVHRSFQTALFDIQWSGIQVGVLKFFAPNYNIGGEAGTNDTRNKTALPPGPASASTGTDLILSNPVDLEDDPRSFKIEVNFKPTEILRQDIFVAVVQALLILGPLNSTERANQRVAITGNGLTVKIMTTFIEMGRSSPPFLLYRHVVSAVAAVPRVMLRHGKFAEVDIRVLIDGVEVGRGSIRQGPLNRPAAAITEDVSVS